MADFPQVRRILYMHAAHRTVGVSRVAAPLGACRTLDCPWADAPADAPIRVLLVPCACDRRSVAAMEAFERILAGNDALHCARVPFATAEIEGLADADCSVVFGRGLQIVRRWSAVDANIVGEGGFEPEEGFDTEVEIATGASRHPVVAGVGTFIARHRFSHSAHLHPSSACLLVGNLAGRASPGDCPDFRVNENGTIPFDAGKIPPDTKIGTGPFPIAWTQERNGRSFYTLLGAPQDFRCREFVRLLRNAIEWTKLGT
jgi:hypothetical protein